MKKLIFVFSLFVFAILFIIGNTSNAGLNHVSGIGSDSMQVCIVTGEEYPMNAGIKYQYLNKEVSFCCGGCVKAFQKEPANYLKEGLHCPVCGEDDAKKDLSYTHEGVKYYFCGSGCKGKFESGAQTYLDNYKK